MGTDFLAFLEEKRSGMSKGHRRLCDYILLNYDKAAYMTASKLGIQAEVSESTVVRFATELGYGGYPEFQRELKGLIKNKLTSVQRMSMNTDSTVDLPTGVLRHDMENIKETIETLDKASFESAVDMILGAKRIYIMGVRSCHGIASFMSYYFDMLFDNVKLVHTTSGSEVFEQLFSADSQDILIAISFPRYSKRIVDAVKFAKSKGANVVSITDNTEAPIAEYSDELLIAKTDISSFVDSLVSPLSIINALIVALGRRKKEELTSKLEALEEIWDEYNVYQKNKE